MLLSCNAYKQTLDTHIRTLTHTCTLDTHANSTHCYTQRAHSIHTHKQITCGPFFRSLQYNIREGHRYKEGRRGRVCERVGRGVGYLQHDANSQIDTWLKWALFVIGQWQTYFSMFCSHMYFNYLRLATSHVAVVVVVLLCYRCYCC